MKPTTEILANMSRNSSAHHDEVFTRVYRYLLRPDLYFAAYKRLQANNGADTRGVNDDTADGFSERKINCIIEALKNGSYEPLPVRRTYIRKKNSPAKKRPLGLPTFTDKLVQDVMRMVLEAIYEPVFSDLSHGFRPNRSCHTALREVKYGFCGVRWFIEGDIRGCFDNIDHNVLISLLSKKVKDARFLQLIRKFLKAGYLENWVYHSTYSGTPQGGILSPILANIYLHELDMFVEKLKKDFYKSPEAQYTREYNRIRARVGKLSKKIASAEGSEKIALVAQWKEERQKLLHTPSRSQTDKEIRYVRYADDFIIGVRGTKEDCAQIKEALKAFIGNALKMELSDEKTLITHSSEAARFLGYDIRIRRNETTKNVGGLPRRALNNQTELLIPLQDKIMNFLFSHGVIMQHENGTIEPVKRAQLVCLTPLEIVETYNSELRGMRNYYGIASNFKDLHYFSYLMEYSCLKTLGGKHKMTISKIKQKYADGHGGWAIPYTKKTGPALRYFANYHDSKVNAKSFKLTCQDSICNRFLQFRGSVNSLESRLKAKQCELCGSTTADRYELHHVHKVKDLKGKAEWERCMIAKRRKTLVVCYDCHLAIHGKTKRLTASSSIDGEPDALRGASPVLGGDCANLPQT